MRHSDEKEDRALVKRMVKREARTGKKVGGTAGNRAVRGSAEPPFAHQKGFAGGGSTMPLHKHLAETGDAPGYAHGGHVQHHKKVGDGHEGHENHRHHHGGHEEHGHTPHHKMCHGGRS